MLQVLYSKASFLSNSENTNYQITSDKWYNIGAVHSNDGYWKIFDSISMNQLISI